MVVVFSAFQGITDQLVRTSKQASRGDRHYTSAVRAIARRHRRILAALVSARRRASALAHVNTWLAELAEVMHGVFSTRELTLRTLDYLMSFGELLSAFIIAESLKSRGSACEFLDSRQIIKTDDTYGAGHVKYDLTAKLIRTYFRKHRGLQIVCGFIASTTDNDTVTLGRGGSDFTASLLGAALRASEVQIWTDVDGVMTADPRKVGKAFSIDIMTYEEAMEMSHFGAKVIHPPTMQPALAAKIPIRIRNTFNPAFAGTLIGRKDISGRFPVKGISSVDEIALLRVEGSGMIGMAGIGHRLFSALAAGKVNVLLVTQASSEYSVCMAVLPEVALKAKQLIEEELRHEIRDRQIEPVVIEDALSIVAIVGENMRKTTGIAARMFRALGRNGINIVAIAQGSSELNISTVVRKTDEAKALNALHDAYFLSDTKSLNLFVVGTGLIGGTLLGQILRQRDFLRNSQNLDIRIRAVANSRKMLFLDEGGLGPHWRERLDSQAEKMNGDVFHERMKQINLSNSVFVDCTASEEVAARYGDILSSSISIVTPNKKANSGSYAHYEELRTTAQKHNVRFLYETNVGAGLPIINTINDLVAGGDRILKIEGVLSGTLSYLFNAFVSDRAFSEVVEEARAKGYTEPDPREDLNGKDVARKLLILAREAGYRLEFRDIRLRSLIPATYQNGVSVEDFMRRLKGLDPGFSKDRDGALREGKVLRYVASFEPGKATVGLSRIGGENPLADLTGSDIIIALTTVNCREHPVVIKGPGAGAEVTATGVFADIIRISHQLD
jgi:aspartokinase/homoserine dehydrogenase 1